MLRVSGPSNSICYVFLTVFAAATEAVTHYTQQISKANLKLPFLLSRGCSGWRQRKHFDP